MGIFFTVGFANTSGRKGVFRTGETIKGQIIITNSGAEEEQFQGVQVQIVGEGKVHWTTTHTKKTGSKKHRRTQTTTTNHSNSVSYYMMVRLELPSSQNKEKKIPFEVQNLTPFQAKLMEPLKLDKSEEYMSKGCLGKGGSLYATVKLKKGGFEPGETMDISCQIQHQGSIDLSNETKEFHEQLKVHDKAIGGFANSGMVAISRNLEVIIIPKGGLNKNLVLNTPIAIGKVVDEDGDNNYEGESTIEQVSNDDDEEGLDFEELHDELDDGPKKTLRRNSEDFKIIF